jgi:hypothetical protein
MPMGSCKPTSHRVSYPSGMGWEVFSPVMTSGGSTQSYTDIYHMSCSN